MTQGGLGKRFAFFVALILSISLIAGCASSSAPEVKGPVTQNPETAPPSSTATTPTTAQPAPSDQKPSIPTTSQNGNLIIHFIDVGQADSILVQLPDGQNMLVDGGNNDDANLVVSYLKDQGVKKLDHVIGTHPHEDHIGGLDVAIRTFDVGKVYLPRVSQTTKTYEDLVLAIREKNLKVTEAKAGVKLDLGQGIEAVLVAPHGSGYEDLNNYSAVIKLTYGATSFLLAGDAEDKSEFEMQASSANLNLKSDVLKVGHHGSTSSTSLPFLQAVSPKYAVISVGKGNSYGHPAPQTLQRLAAAQVQVFRTDELGTIVATSDGKTITWNKQSSPVKERAPDNTKSSTASAGSSGSAGAVVVTTSPPRSVKITSIDLQGETVTIKNSGGSAVGLSGWKIVSEKGNQTFTFPAGTVIQAGGTLKVVSGPNAQAAPGVLFWTRSNVWNNDGDPGALYDAKGNLVSRY